MIDTISFLLPDGGSPKGKDHPVAEKLLPGVGPPDSLKGIREDPVASGSRGYDDPIERDAIQHEDRYAVRQSIPQELMVKGLMQQAEWGPTWSPPCRWRRCLPIPTSSPVSST
jgi:hypothetical protein